MRRLLKSQEYLMRCLGFVLLFGFISLGAIGGCNDDDAKAQLDLDDEIGQDLLINVISGAVLENPEGDGFILQLVVSPSTVFIDERPGTNSGSINTEDFLEDFSNSIGVVPPNAILTLVADDGTVVAVAVTLISVVFDASESVATFLVTPLDTITNLSPLGTSVELESLGEVQSPFGMALLFIDAITATDGPFVPIIPTPAPGDPDCDAAADQFIIACQNIITVGECEVVCELANAAPPQ